VLHDIEIGGCNLFKRQSFLGVMPPAKETGGDPHNVQVSTRPKACVEFEAMLH
jgi:hypothetical protein